MLLALRLGQPDVDAMLGRMTQRQFVEWWGLYQIAPWSDVRFQPQQSDETIIGEFAKLFRT